ncbi:MAG TPA: hypothetical protein VF007_11565 [Stellaceae bacterium]
MRTLAVAVAAILMTTGLANAQRATSVAPEAVLQNTFHTEAQARARCPQGRVVWMNTNNLIYHAAGSHNYAKTVKGAYMCQHDAVLAGRAAPNEKY